MPRTHHCNFIDKRDNDLTRSAVYQVRPLATILHKGRTKEGGLRKARNVIVFRNISCKISCYVTMQNNHFITWNVVQVYSHYI